MYTQPNTPFPNEIERYKLAEIGNCRRTIKITRWLIVVFSITAVAALLINLKRLPENGFWLFAIIALSMGAQFCMYTRIGAVARRLSLLNHAGVAGPMIETAPASVIMWSKNWQKDFTHALNAVGPYDQTSLTPYQRKVYRSLIRYTDTRWDYLNFNPNQIIPVLNLVRHQGTREDVNLVEKLLARSKRADVRAATEICLTDLRARLSRNDETLLIPAQADEYKLVRAASHTAEADQSALLRAANGDENQ